MNALGSFVTPLGPNPCLSCGACCALYRASFYWSESDEFTPGGFPLALTDKLNDFFLVIKGTNEKQPCCLALQGTIGEQVACTEYGARPSPCREFEPSWREGTVNTRCDAARSRWGLKPLTPEDWFRPELPRAA